MSILDEPHSPSGWNESIRATVRARYAIERDKRLRADGPQQYITVEAEGGFAEFLEDHFDEKVVARDPVVDLANVVVIGGGFAGLLTGARLRSPASRTYGMIESGGDFGGTWYWNRYPGRMCDVESYIYLPLLEEVGYMPTREVRPRAGDLRARRAHRPALRHVPRRAVPDRGHRARLGRGDRRDGSSRPTAATASRARFVVMAVRRCSTAEAARHPRHRDVQGPRVPHQPLGLRVHRRRRRRRLDRLHDKRVGIIGTGATAVQAVPAARRVGRSTSTCSSARRRRSTCRATARPTRSGSSVAASRAGSGERMENFSHDPDRRRPERGPGRRRLDRDLRASRQLHEAQLPSSTPEELRDLLEAARLREDGRRSAPRVDDIVEDADAPRR